MQKNKHGQSLRLTFFHVGPSGKYIQQALCCCLGRLFNSIKLNQAWPIRQDLALIP